MCSATESIRMKTPFSFACALLLAASAGAQTCNSVTFTAYGSPCGSAFPNTTLTGTFNPTFCTASVTLNAFPGCCNTFPLSNVWALGLQAAQTPLPGVPQPCFLLNSADFIVTTPPDVTTIAFAVPPALSGTSVFVQAARVYFTTIGMTNDLSVSNGLRADVQ